MRLLARVGWVLAAIAATTVVTLIELEYFQPKTETPGLAAVGVLAITGVSHAIQGSVREFRAARSVVATRAASDALSRAVLSLIRLPGLELERIGVSAWLFQRRLWVPWQQRLVRVARWRMTSSPLPSNITWTRGKGIIGMCWENGNVVAGETATAWAPYENCTQKEWRRVPNDVRLGLSYKEFQRIKGKYQGAVAVPILPADESFVGVICVDARIGTPWDALGRQEVVDIAAAGGSIIGNLFTVLSRWVYTSEV